ncbi:MAG TPA: sugar ABC transporter substrate-binding protein [Chloroflexota bacterium]|nr:sugar ABC transporter substrate-binding protein [Chloroflexota bacterium]
MRQDGLALGRGGGGYTMSRRAVVRAGLLAGGVLAVACGRSTPGADPAGGRARAERVTISYSSWGTPLQEESVKAEVAAWDRKHGALNIEVVPQVQPWDGYHQKLQVQASGGTLPDVNIVSSAFFQPIALQGAFLDVKRYFDRDKLQWDNLPPATRNFLEIDGKLFGLPCGGLGAGGAMVNVNKGLFEGAGLTVPQLDWTWDDLLAHARKITRPGGGDAGPWGVDFGKSTWEAVWQSMLRAYGGDVWNAQRTESTVNSDAAKLVFQYVKDLVDRWNVSHPQGGDPAFYGGQTAMSIAWSGAASTRVQKAEFPVGVAATPRGPAGQGLTTPTGANHSYQLAATTKQPEAAWSFLRFLVTEPEAVRARDFSAVASVAWKPAVPVYAEKVPETLKEWWQVGQFYQQKTPAPAPLAPEVQRRVLPTYDDQMAIISGELKRFYAGESGIAECVSEMKRLLDARLREVQGAR